jgi:hypothetical protein
VQTSDDLPIVSKGGGMLRHFKAASLGRLNGLNLAILALSIAMYSTNVVASDRKIGATSSGEDARDDLSPWGVGSGAEWFSAYPIFNPMLKNAGVRWLRGFYEWQTIQPTMGYWNWTLTDRLMENARANGIRVTGYFAYLARWVSADGGTRRFPMKDMAFWRAYVTNVVTRYHRDIKYWEVWNEFNGSFAENGTPQIYADLVREASVAAKKVDPSAKIGISVANFDVGFLSAAIKAGAANHFDYVCVHPYEKLNALADNGEADFLSMTSTLRQMLAANSQPADIPLWITEIGAPTNVTPSPDSDRLQAVLLAKAYLLSIASGFQRIFWFEARGPSHGDGKDFGLIRADMSPRPSLKALSVMSEMLGPQPKSVGWLKMGDGGYGFVLRGGERNVLALWAPPNREIKITFIADVHVRDLEGTMTSLLSGQHLTLTEAPLFVYDVPGNLVELAKSNQNKPFPWAGDYAKASTVSAHLQAPVVESGIRQIAPETTTPVIVGANSWRRVDFSKPNGEGHYVYFSINSQFAPFGARDFEITAVVRRVAPDKLAGMSLNYESLRGYVDAEYLNIPEGDGWSELTWRISDANFVSQWGWNFRLNGIGSPNEFFIREIRVKKPAG